MTKCSLERERDPQKSDESYWMIDHMMNTECFLLAQERRRQRIAASSAKIEGALHRRRQSVEPAAERQDLTRFWIEISAVITAALIAAAASVYSAGCKEPVLSMPRPCIIIQKENGGYSPR